MNPEIVGVWHLASFEIEDANGIRRPWGHQARGQLIYTSCGAMSVMINQGDPTGPQSPDHGDRLRFLVAYGGRYLLKPPNIVIHQVAYATRIDLIGKELVRHVVCHDRTLSLKASTEKRLAFLVWQKSQP